MTTGNSAPPERIEEMFDRISSVYDGMNLTISAFQEPRWRRRAVRESRVGPGGRALDVACGTGKVTADLYAAVQPDGSATGVDFSAGMIGLARDRHEGPEYLQGDALALPLEWSDLETTAIMVVAAIAGITVGRLRLRRASCLKQFTPVINGRAGTVQ